MLRPIDIQSKTFEKKIKGYDINEVDDFLDKIIHDYDAILKENKSLKDKVSVISEKLESYQKLEKALDETVAAAKEAAESIIAAANAEAENIKERAKLSAANLSKQIDEEHIHKQQQMAAMQNEMDMYRMQIKSVCNSIISMSEQFK